MSKPVVSITDHVLRQYTHNLVARFESSSCYIDYCTYIAERTNNLGELTTLFEATMHVLGLSTAHYTFKAISWQDDF